MVFPRPLDRFVWVQRTDESGKQKIIPRGALAEHLAGGRWERILDPTKKKTADAEAEPESSESAPAAKKAAKKQPAKPDSEKE